VPADLEAMKRLTFTTLSFSSMSGCAFAHITGRCEENPPSETPPTNSGTGHRTYLLHSYKYKHIGAGQAGKKKVRKV